MITRWLIAVSTIAACTDYRQIVLSVDTTAGVPCDIDRLRVVATSSATTTTFERSLEGERLPVQIALLDDTPDGMFTLDLFGMQGETAWTRTTGPLQFAGREDTVPVLLKPRCTAEEPCELPDSMGSAPVRSRCGPRVTRYLRTTPIEGHLNACDSPEAVRVAASDTSGPIRLDALDDDLPGFGFQFYGRTVHRIWVHREGYMSFARENPDPLGDRVPAPLDSDLTGGGLPPPPRSIMAFWDKLKLGESSEICHALEGVPGNQLLRVTWSQVCLTAACTSDNVSFTITLDQASQGILLTYGDTISGSARALGSEATVGLVDEAARCDALACDRDTGLCSDGATPCGYSQVFTRTAQSPEVADVLFLPVDDD